MSETDEETDDRGSACFLDQGRICGADCKAFIDPPSGKAYLGENWANCHILVNLDRAGRNLGLLARFASDLTENQQVASADAARAANSPPMKPPNPGG